MNCNKAKQIDLVNYMKKEGFPPQKIKGNQAWFLSPFRNEKTPSFKVDTIKNIWYDFGEGCGGTIIDFVMKIHQCNAKNALEILSNKSFSFHQQKRFEEKPKYQILSIQNITNDNLINYLKSRKINPQIAKHFCSEIHYTINHKKYFGVGFKNNSNGYEIRNKYVKICLGKKDITHLKFHLEKVRIFEGFMDFLSYKIIDNSVSDFIILNSVSLVNRVEELLENYKIIETYFDNDTAGNSAIEQIKKYRTDSKDYRKIYKNYKDINDYLTQNCSDEYSL